MDDGIIGLLRLVEKISNEREHAKKKRREYAPGVFYRARNGIFWMR